jgi:hypothetical protein
VGAESDKFVVFYAWQSDLPDATNRGLIRRSLRNAASALEETYASGKLHVALDEATRGESGSPNIPLTILRKIARADAFVCDLTPINTAQGKQTKAMPNPNVIFELGYAVAQLGWARVIMLFNESYGTFPDDLPFDVDRHRASPYKAKASSKKEKSDPQTHLTSLLTTALQSVFQNEPARPSAGRVLDPEKTKRQRDIRNLRRALEAIHWPTLQTFMEEAPHLIRSDVFHFWEEFHSIVRSPVFFLNDRKLRTSIEKIHYLWNYTTSFDQHYIAGRSGNYIFHNPGDLPLRNHQQKAWRAIEKALRELNQTVQKFLAHVRKHYVEIDIEETNRVAWLEFLEQEKAAAKAFGDE